MQPLRSEYVGYRKATWGRGFLTNVSADDTDEDITQKVQKAVRVMNDLHY